MSICKSAVWPNRQTVFPLKLEGEPENRIRIERRENGDASGGQGRGAVLCKERVRRCFPEDKPVVAAAIQKMKDEGKYPEKLWEEV